MEQLTEWLGKQGWGAKTALARACGVEKQSVSRWLNGTRIPSREMMTKIRKATGGAVPESAWFEPSEAA